METNSLLEAQHRDPYYEALKQESASGPTSSNSFQREGDQTYDDFYSKLDWDAVHFGIRMAVCMAISSLFILVPAPCVRTVERSELPRSHRSLATESHIALTFSTNHFAAELTGRACGL